MKTFRIDVIGLVMSAITIVFTTTVNAFVVLPTPTSTSLSCTQLQQHQPSGRVVTVSTTITRSTCLQMAGFGSGGGMASSSSSSSSKKGKKKKETSSSSKLKPRKQWDRFLSPELETSDRIRVAVRLVVQEVNDNDNDNNNDENNKWFRVGEIKSKENRYTEASVIRHRVLIADHARRIYPAEIRINDKLEWGYNIININTNSAKEKEEEEKEDSDENNENENENEYENENDDNDNDWTIVQKLDDMPTDIDKLIGFQGYADPTGFYSSIGTQKASGNRKQTGYNTSMGKKGTVGHSPLEVHD